MRKKLAALLCGLLTLVGCSSTPAPSTSSPTYSVADCTSIALATDASVGDAALPDADIECLSGEETINISHLRGPLVMPVWASWCEPCKNEMPILQQFYAAHHDKVAVLGVDLMDTSSQGLGAATNWGVSFPSLEDPDGAYRGHLGITAPPTTLFIDADGQVVYRHIGAVESLQQLSNFVEQYLGVALS
jgi:thiol-disulfide isomerase/thioredoxin